MGMAGMGPWVGAHGGRTGRVYFNVDMKQSIKQKSVFPGTSLVHIIRSWGKHAMLSIRTPRTLHTTISASSATLNPTKYRLLLYWYIAGMRCLVYNSPCSSWASQQQLQRGARTLQAHPCTRCMLPINTNTALLMYAAASTGATRFLRRSADCTVHVVR